MSKAAATEAIPLLEFIGGIMIMNFYLLKSEIKSLKKILLHRLKNLKNFQDRSV